MARARLTEAEREARRKERNLRGFTHAKFRQYDPGDGLGFGSEAQWRAAAGGGFTLGDDTTPRPKVSADLHLLGLTALPTDIITLRQAYRTASKTAHPDGGGTDAAFVAVRQAYARVYEKLMGEQPR